MPGGLAALLVSEARDTDFKRGEQENAVGGLHPGRIPELPGGGPVLCASVGVEGASQENVGHGRGNNPLVPTTVEVWGSQGTGMHVRWTHALLVTGARRKGARMMPVAHVHIAGLGLGEGSVVPWTQNIVCSCQGGVSTLSAPEGASHPSLSPNTDTFALPVTWGH